MNQPHLTGTPVLVVGAGIMGAGIAQVAAQAGHRVFLHDARAGAAVEAKAKLGQSLEALVAKGKWTAAQREQVLTRIEPVAEFADGASAGLVVEAIVESLEAKRSLFLALEAVVGEHCVLATNTSSISVTAIANGLKRPERLVGMHFFNPVALMKLVEVVSGLQTDAAVAGAVFDLAGAWGKVPVHARSTPGFIVNRIARPYYAETLALLLERAAAPQVLDACLRGAGFRMGPCELIDLIGHDTNFAVTQSVYDANFQDKRFVPSLVQREMVDGGLYGRKSGRGFYRYPLGAPPLDERAYAAPAPGRRRVVFGAGPAADLLAARVAALAGTAGVERAEAGGWVGLAVDEARLVMSDGRCAAEVAAASGVSDLVLFDRIVAADPAAGMALATSAAPACSEAWRAQALSWLAALGFAPQPMADAPGLVVTRTLAMLVNEAADAVLQGVCTPDGADAAMKLGVNYPAGPFEWLAAWSAAGVVGVLEALDAHYRGERYRVSPWLRRAAAATAASPAGDRAA